MRNKPPSLLPLLRSERMGQALAFLYLHADDEYSLTDLAEAVDTSPSALHRDIGYLVESGFVTERIDGRSRKLSAREDHPMAFAMRQLLTATFGPPSVIADEMAKVRGIDEELIFGSWAARFAGEPGKFPNDVDVLVVGHPRQRDVHEAAAAASARLRIEVNATVVSPERWKFSDDPLMVNIRERPTIALERETETTTTSRDDEPVTA